MEHQDSLLLAKLFGDDKNSIPYRPAVARVTGSITSAILLQQAVYWWHTCGPEFYKFKQPCEHIMYEEGDSWCEELGFTRHEFDGALSKIAVKNTKDITMEQALEQARKLRKPIVYWITPGRVTYYTVVLDVLLDILREAYASPLKPKSGTTKRRKAAIPSPNSGDRNTETTTETTKEISADADVETPTALATGPMEVDISPGSRTLQCPNPECEKEIRVGSIKQSATACPVCDVPLLILVDGEPYGQPPKPKKGKGEKRILGNLLDDCPPPLALFPYFAREKEDILAAWRGKSKGIFVEALQWARIKYLKDGMPHHLLVRNALGYYRKKESASQGDDPPAQQQIVLPAGFLETEPEWMQTPI